MTTAMNICLTSLIDHYYDFFIDVKHLAKYHQVLLVLYFCMCNCSFYLFSRGLLISGYLFQLLCVWLILYYCSAYLFGRLPASVRTVPFNL